jgi:hypothetical protein
MLQALKGRQIVIDPECRLFLSDDFGEQTWEACVCSALEFIEGTRSLSQ